MAHTGNAEHTVVRRQNVGRHPSPGGYFLETRCVVLPNAVFDRQERSERIVEKLKQKAKIIPVLERGQLTTQNIQLHYESKTIVLSACDNLLDDPTNDRPVQRIPIQHIKEVTPLTTKMATTERFTHMRRQEDILDRIADNGQFMVLYYTDQFTMKLLFCMFESSKICEYWIVGLRYLRSRRYSLGYKAQVDCWLGAQFHTMLDAQQMGLSTLVKKVTSFFSSASNQLEVKTSDVKQFMQNIQTRTDYIKDRQFRQLIKNVTDHSNITPRRLTYDQFTALYNKLAEIEDLDKRFGIHLSREEFVRFCSEKQCELDLSRINEWTLALYPIEEADSIPLSKLVNFLFDPQNTLFDPSCNVVNEDEMKRPLQYYFINSSHNTYLVEDQLKGPSMYEAYARVLLQGCRCVEIDCWEDGSEIVVFHGRTLTSKLRFEEVCKTIREYAFIASEYPVIISIENHCKLSLQRKMAEYFREIFGDMLLSDRVEKDEKELPSPAMLKRKIILKFKKLQIADEVEVPIATDEGTNVNANPRTSMQSTRGAESVVNQSTRISSEDRVPIATDEGTNVNATPRTSMQSTRGAESVVNQSTRTSAEDKGYESQLEESVDDTAGNTSSDLPAQDQDPDDGPQNYGFGYIQDVDKLTAKKVWVRHALLLFPEKLCYKRNMDINAVMELDLSSEACDPVENEEWFHKFSPTESAKEEAKKRLREHPNNEGMFLVRRSTTHDNVYALSVQSNNTVWHCRIKMENANGDAATAAPRYFIDGSPKHRFVSIAAVVQYFQGHSLKFHSESCQLGRPCPQPAPHEGNPWFVSSISTRHVHELLTNCNKDGAFLIRRSRRHSNEFSLNLRVRGKNVDLRIKQDETTGYFSHKQERFDTLGHLVEHFTVKPLPDHDITLKFAVSADGHTQDMTQRFKPATRSIQLATCTAEIYNDPSEKKHRFMWIVKSGSETLIMASPTEEARKIWLEKIQELKDNIVHIESDNKKNKKKITAALSALIVYCRAVNWTKNMESLKFEEMCSINEAAFADKAMDLMKFNQKNLSRCYPKGTRVRSDNMDPMPMWNVGCHMVALNFQGGDKAMHLNFGKFLANGGCGYIPKPSYMMAKGFNPNDVNSIEGNIPITLEVEVIAGRHLSRSDRWVRGGKRRVEVEIVGIPSDCSKNQTKDATHALNPHWEDQLFSFKIQCPEIALIRFAVIEEDSLGVQSLMGQAVYPVGCLRSGYRSVQLRNAHSELLDLSALLVCVQKTPEVSKLLDLSAPLVCVQNTPETMETRF